MDTQQLMLNIFNRHKKCGARLGANFVECVRCELHLHEDRTRLWQHWRTKFDHQPVTSPDDPRLDVQPFFDEAFQLTSLVEIAEAMLGAWMDGQCDTWQEALDLALLNTGYERPRTVEIAVEVKTGLVIDVHSSAELDVHIVDWDTHTNDERIAVQQHYDALVARGIIKKGEDR